MESELVSEVDLASAMDLVLAVDLASAVDLVSLSARAGAAGLLHRVLPQSLSGISPLQKRQ